VRLRVVVELLVQRCCIGCVRPHRCPTGPPILDVVESMGHQSRVLAVSCRNKCDPCGSVRGTRFWHLLTDLHGGDLLRSPWQTEYWLSSLKVVAIVVFILVGIFVNV